MSKKIFFLRNYIKKSPALARNVRRLTSIMPDKLFLSLQFKKHMGESINWESPETFNEKMQWLKVYWQEPLATQCADKYGVRDYVESTIGKKYLTKLHGVYSNVEEIDISKLPQKFVLKATHGSAMNVICKNKKELDWDKEKKKLRNWMKTNYYHGNKEWVYKDIEPKIICEEYLGDNPVDYKLYCFHGEPRYWFVATDRSSGVRADYYELNWEKAPFNWIYPPNLNDPKIPEKSNEMIELARKMAKPFPFVRVDFYEIESEIYFGELTFFHGSGFGAYEPKEYNKILGDMLTLPQKRDSNKNNY